MSNLGDALSSGGSNAKEIQKEISSNLSLAMGLYKDEIKRLNELEFLPKSSGIYFFANKLIWGDRQIDAYYLPEGSVDSALDFNGISYGCPVLKSGEHLVMLDLEEALMPILWWEDWHKEIDLEAIEKQIAEDEAYRIESKKRAEAKVQAERAARAARAEEFYQKVLLFLKWNDAHPRHYAHAPKLIGKGNITPTEKHPECIRWGKYPNHIDCNEMIIKSAEKAGIILTNSRKPIIKKK